MVLPSSARGCLCHPSGLFWFHGFWRTFAAAGCVPSVMSKPQKQDCHTLQRVDLARPFLVSPAIKIEIENSLEMALSKAKSGSAWQSHFWQCGTVEPCDLLETRSSLHYLGGQRGGAQKQTTHQETKTKLSSATPKHPASNVAAESAPHRRHVAKACDNNTQTSPNNMVLWRRLATCRRG